MTAPYYSDESVTLWHGDCLDVLRTLPDASVDAVVTDPPYDLTAGKKGGTGPASVTLENPYGRARITAGFMGQAWDGTGVAFRPAVWIECLRVLKPGGYLLAFGGSRTWHRLAVAVEDAGFEVRDSIAWLTGSGFPKSLNVGKDQRFCQCEMGESDRAEGRLRELRDGSAPLAESNQAAGAGVLHVQLPVENGQRARTGAEAVRLDRTEARAQVRTEQPRLEGRGDAQATEGELNGGALRPVPAGVRRDGTVGRLRNGAPTSDGSVDWPTTDPLGVRESHQPSAVGQPAGEPGSLADERRAQDGRGRPLCPGCGKPDLTGFGTALKPAFEPIVVARKPIAGTVAANVLAHGTGALNIDGCRVASADALVRPSVLRIDNDVLGKGLGAGTQTEPAGRWPTNVVLDGHAADELDRQSGIQRDGVAIQRNGGGQRIFNQGDGLARDDQGYGGQGGASRFFPTFRYEAKAPTAERPRHGEVAHPTVKPLDLMRWLVRLVTPPGGTVLEPFAGSGTTAEACVIEGFRCIAIEREAAYLPLIVARLSKPIQPDLFGGVA